jgi:hypothetical protein
MIPTLLNRACTSSSKSWLATPGGSTIRCVRHMTASPEHGPVVLVYGCSECNWIYRALTPQEASQMSWYAQVAFEKHDCSDHQSGTPLHKKPA